MQFTSEQEAILATNEDLVINAVAGSGKTTTLVSYAASRPANSKILYIAFNKTVKNEAIQKIAAAGITNVRVETAHSLAYDHVMRSANYDLVAGFKTHELCEILKIKTGAGKRIISLPTTSTNSSAISSIAIVKKYRI
jgi:F-box protein, helicase, 18